MRLKRSRKEHGRPMGLTPVISRLLGTVPPRTPGTFPVREPAAGHHTLIDSPYVELNRCDRPGLGEGGPGGVGASGLREHLRERLATYGPRAKFKVVVRSMPRKGDLTVETIWRARFRNYSRGSTSHWRVCVFRTPCCPAIDIPWYLVGFPCKVLILCKPHILAQPSRKSPSRHIL